MTTSIRRLFFGAAGLALAAAVAPTAWAGCGEDFVKTPASWQSTPGDGTSPLLTRVDLPAAAAPTIVGMWKVNFKVGAHIIDFGYGQWHADGTEFFNSGGRAPATQNFCLGVWQQTGPKSFSLNHLGLSYDASGNLNGKVAIKEQVTLTGPNNYTGPFTIDVFDPTSGAPLQHVAGVVFASRVNLTTAP